MALKKEQVMTADGKSRDDRIDMVKGIAIILVVLGHSGFPLTHWVYLFHMAVFFICAGYFITEKNYNTVANLKKTISKRFCSLYRKFRFGIRGKRNPVDRTYVRSTGGMNMEIRR